MGRVPDSGGRTPRAVLTADECGESSIDFERSKISPVIASLKCGKPPNIMFQKGRSLRDMQTELRPRPSSMPVREPTPAVIDKPPPDVRIHPRMSDRLMSCLDVRHYYPRAAAMLSN